MVSVLAAVAVLQAASGSPVSTPFREGWTKLPLPQEVRDGVTWLWAGSELLAFGGCDPQTTNDCVETGDGYTFDPATPAWSPLPEAPLPVAFASAVWTGGEAIFLAVEGASRELGGVSFDPLERSWRTLPPAPVPPRPGSVTIWTGAEVIVWGGGEPDEPGTSEGAAYDPRRDDWREIAEAPLGLNHASVVWTGTEMVVFGSLLDDRNISNERVSVGAAYDPVADSWRRISDSRLSPQATSAVWTGGRMVAWDYDVHSQEYDAMADAWTDPLRMPLDFSECYPESTVVRGLVFGFFCGRVALYDVTTDGWVAVHGGPLGDRIATGGRSYELWRFATPISSGDVVFLPMEGVTLDEGDVLCYGCPGSPISFWAYRPPTP
ncbi:MAG: kelch repeat-containing protein [Actinomycetota bacterium]|nr:kelch repeat-containing protein [Actinomycetota bacterium]